MNGTSPEDEADARLVVLIHQVLEEVADEIPVASLIDAVVERMGPFDGKHGHLVRECAQDYVGRLVERCFGLPQPPDPSELKPGHKHLRKTYSVVRNGKWVTIPVEMLTSHEAEAIARRQEQLAAVYLAKAEALEREAQRREAAAND